MDELLVALMTLANQLRATLDVLVAEKRGKPLQLPYIIYAIIRSFFPLLVKTDTYH